jgi:hypothetical protein
MLTALRKRMTYANVAMTLALVLAMTGGAYAAGKFVITSTKQIKPSVIAQLKGKNGAPGPVGTVGANGKDGAPGPQGPAGKDGANGETGKEGPAGKEGATGKQGATGKEGPKGTTGSPWVAGGTLPSEKTETGSWSLGQVSEGALPTNRINVSISFPIPLEKEIDGSGCVLFGSPPAFFGPCHTHFINPKGKEVVFNVETEKGEELTPTGCGSALTPAGSAANPRANPGELCVYAASTEKLGPNKAPWIRKQSEAPGVGPSGASTAGALLNFESLEKEAQANGTWAVTAP